MGVSPSALSKLLDFDLGHTPQGVYPGISTRTVAAMALKSSLLKKHVGSVSLDADTAAKEAFLCVNRRLASWELDLVDSRDELLIGELKYSLYKFFYPQGLPLLQGWDSYLHDGRTGPGASVAARGTDFYTKMFDSPLSSTREGLLYHYKTSITKSPRWSIAELNRSTNWPEDVILESSNAHFVPKRNDISRLICIEPSLNMFYQLGLGSSLERRLRSYFGIDLAMQPEYNRELARIGSTNDSYVTIDLSSASDSLGMKMLSELLPKPVLSELTALRSPFTRFPDGELVALNMVSTMGNGFTFPLETTLFACVVESAFKFHDVLMERPSSKGPGNFAVFGDDIIVPKAVSRAVLRLLELLGFQVNTDKTFVEGPFRESCGADYFHGQPVRGVYVKSLETMQDRYVAINKLVEWSATTGIPIPATIDYLLASVREVLIPPCEDDSAGIKVPFDFLPKVYRDENGSYRYKAYIPRSYELTIKDSVNIGVPGGLKARNWNHYGLIISVLGGYVRNYRVMLRHKPLRYSLKWRKTHNWDLLLAGSPMKRGVVWRRWKSVVHHHLTWVTVNPGGS